MARRPASSLGAPMRLNYGTNALRSKSWHEFTTPRRPSSTSFSRCVTTPPTKPARCGRVSPGRHTGVCPTPRLPPAARPNGQCLRRYLQDAQSRDQHFREPAAALTGCQRHGMDLTLGMAAGAIASELSGSYPVQDALGDDRPRPNYAYTRTSF